MGVLGWERTSQLGQVGALPIAPSCGKPSVAAPNKSYFGQRSARTTFPETDKGSPMTAPQKLSPQRAVVELVIASVIWGASFPAAKFALMSFGPLWTCSIRFLLATTLALPFCFLSSRRKFWKKSLVRLSLLPGVLMGATLVLQNAGLQETSVTKSSFITVLYIVLVPIFSQAFFKTRVGLSHFFWVGVALLGTALICELETGNWNRGDLLTLGCAITASFHILCLEKLAKQIESPFLFNSLQSFWAGLIPLLFAFFWDDIHHFPPLWESTLAILWLSIAVTLISFLVQIRSQQILSAEVVSMLFLLESPLAALFAYFLFSEKLDGSQWFGAFLILLAAAGALRSQVFKDHAKSIPLAP